MKVDLRLAVNYVPACTCLAKLLMLLLAVSGIHPGQELGGYTLLAAILYTDRLCMRNMIFDANAVLLAVFFSQVQAVVRANSSLEPHIAGVVCLAVGWCWWCTVLIAEPPVFLAAVDKRTRIIEGASSLLMVVIIVGTSYFHAPAEPIGFLAWRAVGFALLSFVWIYLIGIELQSLDHLKENSSQFIARMAPMLYSPLWATGLFFPLASGALGYQFMRRHHPGLVGEFRTSEPYARIESHPSPESHDIEDEEPTAEELFRMAMQRRANAGEITQAPV
jgi:hypothetical protein